MSRNWKGTGGPPLLSAAISARRTRADLGLVLMRLVDTLLLWQARAAERRQLSGLDGRLLADLGLSRADAWREAAKPFWRA